MSLHVHHIHWSGTYCVAMGESCPKCGKVQTTLNSRGMKRWVAIAKDVSGCTIAERRFWTKWGAQRYVRCLPATTPIPGRPMWTWHVPSMAFLKCSKCWSDRGFLITTGDGKDLEVGGQLPMERILETVQVTCLYCNNRWEHAGEDGKWVTLGSYTVPAGDFCTVEDVLRVMGIKVNAIMDIQTGACTRCGKDFDTCPCPVFSMRKEDRMDPHWPKNHVCDQCGGTKIHAEDCPIVVQRRGGL